MANYKLSSGAVARLGRMLKDYESEPGRRPVSPPSASVIGASRVLVAVPRVAADADGYCLGDLYLHDTSNNSYELISAGTTLIALLPDTL
jgi:hypothetical protein